MSITAIVLVVLVTRGRDAVDLADEVALGRELPVHRPGVALEARLARVRDEPLGDGTRASRAGTTGTTTEVDTPNAICHPHAAARLDGRLQEVSTLSVLRG